MDAGLQEWLATSDFDEAAAEGVNLGGDVRDVHLMALVEGVLGVAPRAPQVTSGEADEGAGESRPGRFALDAVEDFIDADPRHQASWRRVAASASSITSLSGASCSRAAR